MLICDSVSLDKLVLCGGRNVRYDYEDYLNDTLFLKYRSIAKYPYRERYVMLDGSNLAVAEIEAQRSGKLKELRVEFNPNSTLYKVEHMHLVRCLYEPHFTRIDVAFDFYDVDMSDWKWIDLQARPQRHYYGRNGKIETVYVGGTDSNIIYRIYNKAVEQKIKDKQWWRIEVEFRREAAQTFYENLDTDMNIFDDVFPVAHYFAEDKCDWQKMMLAGLDIKDKAMIHYLIDNPSGFSELSPNTRSKYKKMMKNTVSFVGAYLRTIYKKNKPTIKDDLANWYDMTLL